MPRRWMHARLLMGIGIVFLQLGDATRAGRLTRLEGLFSILLGRRPAVGHALGQLGFRPSLLACREVKGW